MMMIIIPKKKKINDIIITITIISQKGLFFSGAYFRVEKHYLRKTGASLFYRVLREAVSIHTTRLQHTAHLLTTREWGV